MIYKLRFCIKTQIMLMAVESSSPAQSQCGKSSVHPTHTADLELSMINWARVHRLAALLLRRMCPFSTNTGHERCPGLAYCPLFSFSNSSISLPSKAKTIDHALSNESSNRWTFGGALPLGSLSQTIWSSASRSLPIRSPRILHHIVVTIITRFGKPPADCSQRDFNMARRGPGGSVSLVSVIRWRYKIPEILAFFEELKAC